MSVHYLIFPLSIIMPECGHLPGPFWPSQDSAKLLLVVADILLALCLYQIHADRYVVYFGGNIEELNRQGITGLPDPVLEQLVYENFARLAMDQFGCYVIARVIEHSFPEDRERFMQQLRGHVLKYAKHTFAFNVIERCLVCGNTEQKNLLIDEICVNIGSQNPPLLEMINHPVANQVVKKMWDIADHTQREKMKSAIKKHIPILRNSIYAKHIIAKMDKYFEEVNFSAPSNRLTAAIFGPEPSD